ncbi:MAG: GTP-binding protein [Aphanocapsa lilacina HA4352-LM1]|jgi:hypothetical protein|nr:GTP-binding protein [Aphanocapsa lilacina HA4352-LM1]
MNSNSIVAVTGPPGVGKTTWIRQQLSRYEKGGIYCSPGTESVPIDWTRLVADFPGKLVRLVGNSCVGETGFPFFIELGYHLNLSSAGAGLEGLNLLRVAVVPPQTDASEWYTWADEVAVGAPVERVERPQLWRAATTGEVIDIESLDVFWEELTGGAYGRAVRVKGIFEVSDGRALFGEFVAGVDVEQFTELSLPRWWSGRPRRFSGIEVFGEDLDEAALGETLRQCCLNDQALAHYQQQIKDQLAEAEVIL